MFAFRVAAVPLCLGALAFGASNVAAQGARLSLSLPASAEENSKRAIRVADRFGRGGGGGGRSWGGGGGRSSGGGGAAPSRSLSVQRGGTHWAPRARSVTEPSGRGTGSLAPRIRAPQGIVAPQSSRSQRLRSQSFGSKPLGSKSLGSKSLGSKSLGS